MKNNEGRKEIKNIKKKKNTFKFQNFAERISNIKVDVYHSIGTKEHQFPENDKDTFFRENLEKWTELNCSLDFTAFYREIKRYVQSFNQLLFHKETVLEILKRYLSLKTPLALEPCLDLVATLSRDLLVDFCPYFEEIFTLLTGFLTTHDTDLIEHTFVSLAHIFKFIWRYLVADIKNVFKFVKVFKFFSFLIYLLFAMCLCCCLSLFSTICCFFHFLNIVLSIYLISNCLFFILSELSCEVV